MTPVEPSPKYPSTPVSKAVLGLMAFILVGTLLVAIHMNVVRWQRDKIEKVTVTPVPTPTASPSASP